MPKQNILKDAFLQQKLEEDGFVKVSLFAEDEMKPLLDCYEKYAPLHFFSDAGFHHTTHHTQDWQLIHDVSDCISKILKPRLEEIFCNYSVLGGNFILKDHGDHTEFVPHQDWTLVDEEQFYSLNLWIPLHDLTGDNGKLRFLAGSQRLIRNLRMAPSYPDLYGNIMESVYPHMTTVPLKMGEAVVFDCCVLHGSYANTTNDYRKNIIMGIYSRDAEFKFYYNTEKGSPQLIEEYKIAPDEFLTFAVGERPAGRKPDRVFNYEFPVLSLEEFDKLYIQGIRAS